MAAAVQWASVSNEGSGLRLLTAASDERLVELARAGDERAFTAIVERYRAPLLRYCRTFLPGAAAEDALQQTFMNAYVADVVRAIRAAAEAVGAAGRACNVGGGAPLSVNAALEQLASIAGRPLDVRRAGREAGDVSHTAADGSRARDELGFTPATSLAEGLRAEYEWVLERAEAEPGLAAVRGA